jgi:hypothetical protein
VDKISHQIKEACEGFKKSLDEAYKLKMEPGVKKEELEEA